MLDERRYEEWLQLWAEEGIYWVPINEELDPHHHVSVIYDDDLRRRQRIGRLRSDAVWAFIPPPETVRVVSNIEVEAEPGEQERHEVTVHAKYVLGEFRKERQDVFFARVKYRLRADGGEFRIVLKQVLLINRTGVFEAVTAIF